MTTATTTTHRPPYIHSRYLCRALDPNSRRKIITSTIQALWPHRLEFDTIAFRGISGALIAPEVAQYLQKPLIVVRKGESNHSGMRVEGNLNTQKYVIVDDQICSGGTIEAIKQDIAESQLRIRVEPGICYGIAMYFVDPSPKVSDFSYAKYYQERFGVEHVWQTRPTFAGEEE